MPRDRAGIAGVYTSRAEPARAGIEVYRYGKVPFQTVTTLDLSELYTGPQLSFKGVVRFGRGLFSETRYLKHEFP